LALEKKPFVNYGEKSQNSKEKVIPTKWNEEEQLWLKDAMRKIRQPKKGTAIKQLARIGFEKVVQSDKMIENLLENYRKNTERGIGDVNKEIQEKW
jgi:hypothetical protein